MTTAHRPTFDPARGKDVQRGPAYHQRTLPAHTHLKQRQTGQGGAADANGQRDLRAELLKAEAAVRAKKAGKSVAEQEDLESDGVNGIAAADHKRKLAGDEDDEEEDPETKRRRLILEQAAEVDASSSESEDDSEDDSSDDDSEDEQAELQRELEKIRAERAAKQAKEDEEKAKKAAEDREVHIARSNPLLDPKKDFETKRRWDDDVVFKNQARGTKEREAKGGFTNDLLRSDFHKKFMSKYIR